MKKNILMVLLWAMTCQATFAQGAADALIKEYLGLIRSKVTGIMVADYSGKDMKELAAFSEQAEEKALMLKMTRMSIINAKKPTMDIKEKFSADVKKVEKDGYRHEKLPSNNKDFANYVLLVKYAPNGTSVKEVVLYSIGDKSCDFIYFAGSFNKTDIIKLITLGQ